MGLVLAWNVTNYMLTSYMPTYVTATMPDMQGGESVSETTSQLLQFAVMVVALLTIPLVGILSDRIGRKPIVWVGAVGLIVLALPSILLIRAQTGLSIFLGLLVMGLLLICFSATMHPRRPRCSRPRCARRPVDRVQRLGLAVRRVRRPWWSARWSARPATSTGRPTTW
jgi:MFS transporter, MHS family, proline/betaine transporter